MATLKYHRVQIILHGFKGPICMPKYRKNKSNLILIAIQETLAVLYGKERPGEKRKCQWARDCGVAWDGISNASPAFC